MWDPKLANFSKERLHSAYAFDVWGPYFREYFCLNKNVRKAWQLELVYCCEPFQHGSETVKSSGRDFPVRGGGDHHFKFIFQFACHVIRNFTETYNWMPILTYTCWEWWKFNKRPCTLKVQKFNKRPGARFSKVPIINGPGKLCPFTKIEVSIVLHLTW